MKIKVAVIGMMFGVLAGLWLSGCGTSYRYVRSPNNTLVCTLSYENVEPKNKWWHKADLYLDCPGHIYVLVKEDVEFSPQTSEETELVFIVPGQNDAD